jgi:hypothetical protein
MLPIERFIAWAIRFVRIVPDAPTIIPATIRAVLSSARPIAAADSPVKALSSEITTGMSAPPIGRTTMFPRTAAATRIAMKSASDSSPAAIATAHPTAASRRTRFTNDCPGSMIGRPGMTSCSFPNAMFEPQKETEPMIAAKRIGISCSRSRCPSAWRNSAHATSATAPPPTPLNSATICGIAVIFTFRAAGTPTTVPITTPRTISSQSPICSLSRVAATATAIPTAAILFPWRAVAGWVRRCRPTTKRMKARR